MAYFAALAGVDWVWMRS